MAEEAVFVQTRSVEHILTLLVAQTTTLVTWQAERWAVGAAEAAGAAQAACDLLRAVERFAALGELLAAQEPELGPAALRASADLRGAGKRLAQLMGASVSGETEDTAASGHPRERGQRSELAEAGPEHPGLERAGLERAGLERAGLERAGLERAARLLLSSVARTLLLADQAAVKHIVGFRNQVLRSLEGLEAAESPAEMVPAFNDFSEAIEPFVNLSAERERDLKDERQAARIAAARDVLEKVPMMLLTACKTLLAHGDCEAARAARGLVLERVRAALGRVADTVREPPPGGSGGPRGPAATTVLQDSTVAVSAAQRGTAPGTAPDQEPPVRALSAVGPGPAVPVGASAGPGATGGPRSDENSRREAVHWLHRAIDALKAQLEGLREGPLQARRLQRASLLQGAVRDGVRAFAGAASVRGEHRDPLLRLMAQAQGHVEALASAGDKATEGLLASVELLDSVVFQLLGFEVFGRICRGGRPRLQWDRPALQVAQGQSECSHEMELTLIAACHTLHQLQKQLHVAAVAGAVGLLSSRPGERELTRLPEEAAAGREAGVRHLAARLTERQEALSEVCQLLRHVAETEPLGIRCSHLDDCIQSTVQQVVSASQVLLQNPESQSARELFEVCRQAWAEGLAGLTVLVRDTVELSRENGSSQSLHRHTGEAEVSRLAGDVRERTGELEAETERWPGGEAHLLLSVQNVCNTAYAACLLTRGGGLYKCMPDLFKKAAVLADECVELSSLLENFTNKLGHGEGQARLAAGVEQVRLCVTAVRDASAIPAQEQQATMRKAAAVMQAVEDLLATLLPTVQITRILKDKMGAWQLPDSPGAMETAQPLS